MCNYDGEKLYVICKGSIEQSPTCHPSIVTFKAEKKCKRNREQKGKEGLYHHIIESHMEVYGNYDWCYKQDVYRSKVSIGM